MTEPIMASFPDDEGRRAWTLDLAVSMLTSSRGFLGRDEAKDDDEVSEVLKAAESFYEYIRQGN